MAEGQTVRSFSVGPIRTTKEEASRRPTTLAGVGDQLARRFYDARPANSGTSTCPRSGATIYHDALTWEEAQEQAAPYVADLRHFGRIAVGLEG